MLEVAVLVGVFAFGFLFSGLACLFFLAQAIFVRGRRKSRLLRSGAALLVVIGSLVGFAVTTDQEARNEGYLGSTDKSRAEAAGITDPTVWAGIRLEQQVASDVDARAAAVSKAEADETLDEIGAYVTEVTQALPSKFQDHGNLIPEEARLQPLADDVIAYARFYWTVDAIESYCPFLGQRNNIEMLSPRNGVSSWVSTASMAPKHPDYGEYREIFEKVGGVVDELGEATVCPAMYQLLGPDGSLMEEALDINGLIDPEIFHRYEVKVEDGILWSSKDYCKRRYYLEQLSQPSLHDLACEEAEEQDF